MPAKPWASRRVIDSRYPVSLALEKAFGGAVNNASKIIKKEKGETGPPPRADIVSESLCDDTIKYLAPTLEQHKGCTLIDVHPGACLWSSKLHDFLKPKRHLLMEPEKRYYEPFIKPLLDKPGSTYRYTALSGAHPSRYWDTWKTVMDDPELLQRPALPLGDPKRTRFDPNVLLIGNLARRYQEVHRRPKSVRYSNLILAQMCLSVLRADMVHRDGSVRMLWWAPESEAYLVFPETEANRQSLNVTLAMSVSINQAIGVQTPYEAGGRHHRYVRHRPALMDAISASRVERSMHETGMQLPENRVVLQSAKPESDIKEPDVTEAAMRKKGRKAKGGKNVEASDKVQDAEEPPKERSFAQTTPSTNMIEMQKILEGREVIAVNPLAPTNNTIDGLRAELDDARARLAALKDEGLCLPRGNRGISQTEVGFLHSLHFPQSAAMAETFNVAKARVSSVALAADMSLRIVKLEASLKLLEDEDKDKSSLGSIRESILALDNEYDTWIGTQSKLKDMSASVVDSQVAFFCSPPLLAVEAREYEPLKAEDNEFWPRDNLMLLDMMPKFRDLSVPDLATAGDSVKVAQMLIQALMEKRGHSVPYALDCIAPNAAQDLIPQVPAITDPRQGGRLNPNNIRAKMLSPGMIEGLVKAWAEWPFKPSTLELELAADNDGPAEQEEEGMEGADAKQ